MTSNQWLEFINDLDDYLWSVGWAARGTAIKQRCEDKRIKTGNYEQIIDYLTEHCYERKQAEDLIRKISQYGR